MGRATYIEMAPVLARAIRATLPWGEGQFKCNHSSQQRDLYASSRIDRRSCGRPPEGIGPSAAL